MILQRLVCTLKHLTMPFETHYMYVGFRVYHLANCANNVTLMVVLPRIRIWSYSSICLLCAHAYVCVHVHVHMCAYVWVRASGCACAFVCTCVVIRQFMYHMVVICITPYSNTNWTLFCEVCKAIYHYKPTCYRIILSQCEGIDHHKINPTSVHRDPLPNPNLANFQLIVTWATTFIVLQSSLSYFTHCNHFQVPWSTEFSFIAMGPKRKLTQWLRQDISVWEFSSYPETSSIKFRKW